MNIAAHPNLFFAWLWMLAGFLSGTLLGLKFHDDNWLGGYASFKRRMYRLAHISFFGLGAVNLFFHLSWNDLTQKQLAQVASLAFIIGGISMPICCWLTASQKQFRHAFALPVLSLVLGAVLTLLAL